MAFDAAATSSRPSRSISTATTSTCPVPSLLSRFFFFFFSTHSIEDRSYPRAVYTSPGHCFICNRPSIRCLARTSPLPDRRSPLVCLDPDVHHHLHKNTPAHMLQDFLCAPSYSTTSLSLFHASIADNPSFHLATVPRSLHPRYNLFQTPKSFTLAKMHYLVAALPLLSALTGTTLAQAIVPTSVPIGDRCKTLYPNPLSHNKADLGLLQ
jgi:hypothetical protein